MQTVKEFGGSTPKMSVSEFWWTSGPVLAAILLLTVVIIVWKRPFAEGIKKKFKGKLGLSHRKGAGHDGEEIPGTEKSKTDVKKKQPWYRRERMGDPEAPNLATVQGAATVTTAIEK